MHDTHLLGYLMNQPPIIFLYGMAKNEDELMFVLTTASYQNCEALHLSPAYDKGVLLTVSLAVSC